MINDIIPHEERHRETGGMGGIYGDYVNKQYFVDLVNKLKTFEDPFRIPGENYAYAGGERASIIEPYKYYMRGDFRRQLNPYEQSLKY